MVHSVNCQKNIVIPSLKLTLIAPETPGLEGDYPYIILLRRLFSGAMLIFGSVGDGGSASSSSSSSSDEASEESADPGGPPVPSAAGGKVVTIAKGQKKGLGRWGSQGLNWRN